MTMKLEKRILRRRELEARKLEKPPVRLNDRDYLLINSEKTVERKYYRFLEYLREREKFEEDFRRRFPDE